MLEDKPAAQDLEEEDEEPSGIELVTFKSKEAYVYRIPPSTTGGHYAELWGVDNWLQEISVCLVTAGSSCTIRLLDRATGDLFAECPLPHDAPLRTVVEPVVDSSRYFALRITDQQSGRHAFVGIGFRERSDASDFNAALHDYQQFLSRDKAAAEMRRTFGAPQESRESSPTMLRDYRLKEGQTLNLKLRSAVAGASSRPGLVWTKKALAKAGVAVMAGMETPCNAPAAISSAAPLKLVPPPGHQAAAQSTDASVLSSQACGTAPALTVGESCGRGSTSVKKPWLQHSHSSPAAGKSVSKQQGLRDIPADDAFGDFVG